MVKYKITFGLAMLGLFILITGLTVAGTTAPPPHSEYFNQMPKEDIWPYSEGSNAPCWGEGCHSSEAYLGESADGTRFRNGDVNLHRKHSFDAGGKKKATCGTCHETGGTDARIVFKEQPKVWPGGALRVYLTDSGGSCFSGCHKQWEYNREGAVGEQTSPEDAVEESDPESGWVTVTDEFSIPEGQQPRGIVFARDKLFVTNRGGDGSWLHQLDTEDGSVLASFGPQLPGKGGPGALAFDGEYLWHVDSSGGRLSRISLEGGDGATAFGIVEDTNWPFKNSVDLAWDGKGLWYRGINRAFERFDPIRRAGNIRPIPLEGMLTQNVRTGVAFDGSALWLASGTELIRLDPGTGAVLLKAELPHPGTDCLAWDGERLWAAGAGVIYRIEIE